MSHHAQLLLLQRYNILYMQGSAYMPLCPHAELMKNKMSSSSFCIKCNATRPRSASSTFGKNDRVSLTISVRHNLKHFDRDIFKLGDFEF
jgi:hypothetical protein